MEDALLNLLKSKVLKRGQNGQKTLLIIKKHKPSSEESGRWCKRVFLYLTSPDPKIRSCGSALLTRITYLHPNLVKAYFSEAQLFSCCPDDLSVSRSIRIEIVALKRVLVCIKSVSTQGEAFSIYQVIQRYFSQHLVCTAESNTPERLPTLETQLSLLNLWQEFKWTIPTDTLFRTDTLVRWLAVFPDKIAQTASGQTKVSQIVQFCAIRWKLEVGKDEPKYSLMTMIALLAGVPIFASSEVKPSSQLCRLLPHVPLSLLPGAPHFVAEICNFPGATDEQLQELTKRLLQFPLTERISRWVMSLIEGFCIARKFGILARATREMSVSVTMQIYDQRYCAGAVQVLRKLLLGYQHSPDAFHNSLGQISKVLDHLKKPDLPVVYSAITTPFCEMVYACMYKHTGYPHLYSGLVDRLSVFNQEKPSELALRHVITHSRWLGTSATDWRGLVGTQVGRRAVGGKVGLRNLGSTCYMNSVTQAMFITDAFRYRLSSENRPKLSKISSELRKIFHSLDVTADKSLDPSSFVESLPDLFTKHRQEDANEFSQFLLDRVHMDLIEPRSSNSTSSHSPPHNSRATAISKLRALHKVDRVFGGLHQSTIRCTYCGAESHTLSAFSELSLAFPHSSPPSTPTHASQSTPLHLNALVKHYLSPVDLCGTNAYLCSSCGCKRDATQQFQVIDPPDHLVCCVKRFAYDVASQRRTKIMREVKCPVILHLPVKSCSSNNVDEAIPDDFAFTMKKSHSIEDKATNGSIYGDVEMSKTSESTSRISRCNGNESCMNGSSHYIDNQTLQNGCSNTDSEFKQSKSSPHSPVLSPPHSPVLDNNTNGLDTSKKVDETSDSHSTCSYVLYGAVVHSGSSAQYGHYYTIGRHSDEALKSVQDCLEGRSPDEVEERAKSG
eukprot:979352_1